jgi:hypothetical protein
MEGSGKEVLGRARWGRAWVRERGRRRRLRRMVVVGEVGFVFVGVAFSGSL